MFVDVVSLVRHLAPDLLTHARPSVASVRTTNQKYLVFDGDASHPACVVEIGGLARLRRVDGILRTLAAHDPGLVPRSIACIEYWPDIAVHIQQGVAGAPWFRLFDSLPARADWVALLDRSVACLRRLQAAVGAAPEWSGPIDIGDALAGQVRQCRAGQAPIDAALLSRLDARACRLRGEAMLGSCQHGDFSLNNLMVSPDSMTVIDFEEFGMTRTPLHDAFGLALSLDLSQDGRCPLSLAECLDACLGPAAADPEITSALFLHHLLWRINQCDGRPTRAVLRQQLAAIVAQVCDRAPAGGATLSVPVG